MQSVFEHCPNCRSARIGKLKGFEAKHLSTCDVCGFIFDQRIPTESELQQFYGNYSYSRRKLCPPATIDSYNNLLDQFERFRSNGRILDVGCARAIF